MFEIIKRNVNFTQRRKMKKTKTFISRCFPNEVSGCLAGGGGFLVLVWYWRHLLSKPKHAASI